MLDIQYIGHLLTGFDAIDVGLSDLNIVNDDDNGVMLIALSPSGQGLVSWSLGSIHHVPILENITTINSEIIAGVAPSLTHCQDPGGISIVATGVNTDALAFGGVDGTTGVTSVVEVSTGSDAWISSAALSNGVMAFGSLGGGLTLVDVSSDSNWIEVYSQANEVASTAGQPDILESVTVEGTDILIAASAGQANLSTYTSNGTQLFQSDTLDQQDGTGLMVPTDLSCVTIGGETYLIASSSSGTNGVLSVFQLDQTGALEPTDQILDTRDTRFGSVQTIATIPYDTGALIVGGGGDDGLSLFVLNPNGMIAHLSSFEDTVFTGLTNVDALDLHLSGTTLQIFVTSQGDAGITMMTVDLSTFGTIGNGEPVGGRLRGTALDDVLFGSIGSDLFVASGGSDVFVIPHDPEHTDTIQGFDPSTDRLDLSDWHFLYSTDDLTISATNNGAIILFRGQALHLQSLSGTPFDVESIRSAVHLSVNRLPTPEPVIETGTSQDDVIEGFWSQDTLSGGDGDDTLFGNAGDDILSGDGGSDTIYGGSGYDTVIFDGDRDGFVLLSINDGTLTFSSDDGIEVISQVEAFEFDDGMLDIETLTAPENLGATVFGTTANDTITATNFDDRIEGGRGEDALFGGRGNDIIQGNGGFDAVFGGIGSDTISGGNGNDTIYGGSGGDSLAGNRKADVIYGDDGSDFIKGNAGNDEIHGGGGNDTIKGGKGQDTIHGDDGQDLIRGGNMGDTIFGNAGDDIINGEAGLDIVRGGAGRDTLFGGAKADELFGGTDQDALFGGNGNDALFGGSGQDTMMGENGSDTLVGGAGNDKLKGGPGADVFVFFKGDGHDTILGFNPNKDELLLSEDLFRNLSTGQEVINRYAVLDGSNTILDFGQRGSITFLNFTDFDLLANEITIG